MKSKTLIRLALIGIASGYCLTAQAASVLDNGVVAMSKQSDRGSCRGSRGCNNRKQCNNRYGKKSCNSRKNCSNKKSCSRKTCNGCGRHSCLDKLSEKEKGPSDKEVAQYDMTGRRRKASS